MAHDINSALERLETNLQNIDSARQQVEDTVASSIKLQKAIETYTSDVNEMCKKVEDSASDFDNKTRKDLENFSQHNAVLSEQVNKLKSLRDEIVKTSNEIQEVKLFLSTISNDLKDSQGKQDEILNQISNNVSKIPNDINLAKDCFIKQISTSKNELINNVTDLNEKVKIIDGKCNDIKETISDVFESINTSTTSIISSIKEAQKNTSKRIDLYSWLIIASLIALIITLFIIK